MNQEVAHFYRKFRQGMKQPAEAAYQSARSHVYFLKRLGEMVATNKRRSAAAKRGHKTRKTTAQ